jgi:outer membrane protein assembly factor BamB
VSCDPAVEESAVPGHRVGDPTGGQHPPHGGLVAGHHRPVRGVSYTPVFVSPDDGWGAAVEPLESHDPEMIGRYRLRARLGAGGMGQVYLGEDAAGALVALKVVHPGLAHDARFRSRFRREVEVSRRVTGRWVAAVVDADPDARAPWLATEYVPGPSLDAAVTAAGPLPEVTVRALAHGLAAALGAIHQAGVVHRDVKPSNVLLDADHPRLIDFGISRAIDGTRMTSTGVVIGTPAFMSPEQIAGAEAGAASDVFSLGSVLVYAATGRGPFGDLAPVVLMLRISQHDPDLTGVPEALRGPMAACLAKRPQDRPTPAELGELLGPVDGDGPGWLSPTIAALVPDAGTAVPATGVGEGTRVETTPADPTAPRGVNRRLVLAAIGVGSAALAGTVALGVALNASADGGASAPPPGPPAPRVRWTVPFADTINAGGFELAWAVDASTLYAHTREGVMRAWDTTTGTERWSTPGWLRPDTGIDPRVTLAPIGDVLVIATGSVVAALDAATGRRRWEVPRSVSIARIGVAEGVVVGTTSDGMTALDVWTGRRLWATSGDQLATHNNVAAQPGVFFAAATWPDRLEARDLRSGELRWSYPTGNESLAWVVAAGDLAIVGYQDVVLAVDAATGQPRWNSPLPLGGSALHGYGLTMAGDVLVALVEGRTGRDVLRGLDPASGAERWAVPDDVSSDLLTADGSVYLVHGPTSGYPTAAYDAATGAQRWRYSSPGEISEPVAARGPDAYLLSPRSSAP